VKIRLINHNPNGYITVEAVDESLLFFISKAGSYDEYDAYRAHSKEHWELVPEGEPLGRLGNGGRNIHEVYGLV
jgi:hypothetical protein